MGHRLEPEEEEEAFLACVVKEVYRRLATEAADRKLAKTTDEHVAALKRLDLQTGWCFNLPLTEDALLRPGGEESHIGLTESFIEKATASETTTAAADLLAAEENNSPLHSVVEATLETDATADCRTPSSVSLKEPSHPTTTASASSSSSVVVISTPTAGLRCALKTTTSSSAKRQPLSVQFNRFSEQKGLTSRKRVAVPTKLFDGEKPSEQLDDEDAVDENAESALSHNDLVTVVEESHNSLTASFIEMETTTTTTKRALPTEEEDNNLLHSVVGTSTTDDCQTPTTVTMKELSHPATAAAVASALKVKSTPSSISRIPRRALKTAATTRLASRQLPNVQFNCFSEQKVMTTSRKRVCLSTKLFDGEKPKEQLDDAVDRKAENALVHNDNHKLIIRPFLNATVLVNERVLEENAEYALSHDDLIPSEFLSITLEESHHSLTESFIETATDAKTTTAETALPAAKENNSPLHSVVETSLKTSTTDDCRTPRFVSLKKPNSPASSSSVVVKSTPTAAAAAAGAHRRALKTAAKTTGLASRQLPSVKLSCLSEQKGMMTSRKRVFASAKLFDGEKPKEQLDDAVVDEKAENAQISHNDSYNKLIMSLNATVDVNEKVLEENAETALSHNDLVSNEGLSTTLEESHIGMTESFIETATASKTTTTTTAKTALPAAVEENNSPLHSVVGELLETDTIDSAHCQTPSSLSLKNPKSPATVAADLPVAAEEEKEKKNSPLRPVVEASSETPSTITDHCQTPSSVSLKEPNSHPTTAASSASSSSSSSVVVISTPTAGLRCALKTTTSSSSAKRQPLSVQFNRFSEQKGLTSRKRVAVPTKLFDGEKPADEQLDDEDEADAVDENDVPEDDLLQSPLAAAVATPQKKFQDIKFLKLF
ncbi:hypothetical protein TYRP_010433 [Tyrophagus putrescentiae]|nr:hypothetical protein TYRP_010433 [Tyrophagus putrescentiae]